MGAPVLPTALPVLVWHQILYYTLLLRAKMRPLGQCLPCIMVTRETDIGRALAQAVVVAGKGEQAALPCWEGDLGGLVQWGQGCQP